MHLAHTVVCLKVHCAFERMPFKVSKEALRRVVSVILRVPSLFIAEAWYRTSPTAMQQQYLGKDATVDRSQEILIQVIYYSGEYDK